MHRSRAACRIAARATVAATIALAALVGQASPAPAATNPACKLLTPKVIKSTLGLTLPKGKPTKVIDEEEESSACVWASGTPSPQQISTGTPGIYLALVNSGAALSPESSDDSEDDDTTQSLLEVDLKVTGGQSGFAAAIPGGGGTTAGIVFNDSSGAAILIGSTAPTAIQLDAFASAIAKKHG